MKQSQEAVDALTLEECQEALADPAHTVYQEGDSSVIHTLLRGRVRSGQ